jgi:vacuolar iron transporter family protein
MKWPELSEKDALEAHARDELGINEIVTARPIQAAVSSALSFSAGAVLPLLAALFAPAALVTPVVAAVSLLALVLLGMASAKAGGAGKLKAIVRIVFWGAAAMLVTGLIGAAFGTVV